MTASAGQCPGRDPVSLLSKVSPGSRLVPARGCSLRGRAGRGRGGRVAGGTWAGRAELCAASDQTRPAGSLQARGSGGAAGAGGLRPLAPASGDADVVTLRGSCLLVLGQLRVLGGCHDAPVLAHWTALQPPPAEPNGLERSAWYPKRRVQVPAPAPYDGIGREQRTSALCHDDGLCKGNACRNSHDHLASHTPSVGQFGQQRGRAARRQAAGSPPPSSSAGRHTRVDGKDSTGDTARGGAAEPDHSGSHLRRL